MKHKLTFERVEPGLNLAVYSCDVCKETIGLDLDFPDTIENVVNKDGCRPWCKDFAHSWKYDGLKQLAMKPDSIALVCNWCGRKVNIEIHKLLQTGHAMYTF